MNKYLQLSKYLEFAERKIFGWQRIYSQCGEDIILNMMIGKADGFYVDIGANDPRHFNNTYLFYKKGWHGINIEPNINKIKSFNRMRPRDINLNIGIAGIDRKAPYFSFKEDTLSTFSEEIAKDYQSMGHILNEVKDIDLKPLSKVLAENLSAEQKIDFMSIDTEGYDIEVLKSNDWQKYRPSYIIVESLEYKKEGNGKKLDDVFDEFMSSINYIKVIDTYINSIYKDNSPS